MVNYCLDWFNWWPSHSIFTQRGLRKPTAIVPWPWLDNSLLGGTLLIAVCYALGLGNTPQLGLAVLLMVVATGHGVRWLRWHDVGLWRVPLLWSLYLAYLWLIVGMLGVALWHLGVLTTISPAFQALFRHGNNTRPPMPFYMPPMKAY